MTASQPPETRYRRVMAGSRSYETLRALAERHGAKALLDPEQAFRYLARYTARVGFSNHRLVGYEAARPGRVVFGTKHGEEVCCSRVEIAARFARHVLPRGFHRVRRYGLLAPCKQRESLAAARDALRVAYPERAAECVEPEVVRPDGSFVLCGASSASAAWTSTAALAPAAAGSWSVVPWTPSTSP